MNYNTIFKVFFIFNTLDKTTFKYNKIYDARVRIPLLGAKHI